MPVKNKAKRAARRADKQERYRKRVPNQPNGMHQGKHLAGFKGTKVEGTCLCGGCNAKRKTSNVTV